jgi:hypothetical protein
MHRRSLEWQILPEYGFLAKRNVQRHFLSTRDDPQSSELEDDEALGIAEAKDEAVVHLEGGPSFLVDFFIVFSPTFRVPVLYFQAKEFCEFPASFYAH